MAEPILIGTRGWDQPQWTGTFYPEILPPEWRLSFYSNNLRAVLVPAEIWETAERTAVRDWLEDCYPEFAFVLELPATPARPGADADRRLTEFCRTVEPLRAQTAGVLVRVAPRDAPDSAWLTRLLAVLASSYPTCADLPPPWRTPECLALLTRHDAGLCWHAANEAAPHPGGRLLVAFSSGHEAREQRRLLERLHAWQGESGLAAAFFDNPRAARQARLLAELMGV